jgi:hypothetical protein
LILQHKPQKGALPMNTTNLKKFKGEIEQYLATEQKTFDTKMARLFDSLRIGTLLALTKIRKQEGYHAFSLLFTLINLPFLQIRTVRQLCRRQYFNWSESQKDTLYRFKSRGYRWRSFLYKVLQRLVEILALEKLALEEKHFIIDDTILAKRGKKMENVSYVYDHNQNRSLLGYNLVALGLFTGKSFFPVDFSFRFGKKRDPRSPVKIGDPRRISGQMSFEAAHHTKIDLALQMIQRAWSAGIRAGYVLFDSWFAWPKVIEKIRSIDPELHVICRLKKSKVRYLYQGKPYTLEELYQKVRHGMHKDSRLGILLKRISVQLPDGGPTVALVFTRGYKEPEAEQPAGSRKNKEPHWVAFLSTDTSLHSSTIIKKYTKRWTVEVFFKECKQLLGLGKEQAQVFNAQVFSVTAVWLRYNLLSFLNQNENYPDTLGVLFDQIAEASSLVTYSQRLWEFFSGLFRISFATLFDLFKIEEDFSSYFDVISQALSDLSPLRGCET